jgi:hypothetical protein
LTIYLATLVCPTSMPSLSNSPWIRRAPHSGLAMLISRISLRISSGTVGRPPRPLDFQHQYDRKPARCQRTMVSGFTIASASQILVHYCGEQFDNDGSIGSILLKSVKRVMAGEYSPELSVKVFAEQCRLVEHGFVREDRLVLDCVGLKRPITVSPRKTEADSAMHLTKIAILGWGSLLWDTRPKFSPNQPAHPSILPEAFLRIS